MKVKLISPRATQRPMDSAWKTQMSPPLGLLVLGSLTGDEHDVELADENVGRISLDDNPDLVGITVKVDTCYRAAAIAGWYRARGIPVVVGGIHATACPDECARFADSVVIGEAEKTWRRVLADAVRGELKQFYSGGATDIASVPAPRWELLDERGYLFTNTLRIGRGCPWQCEFCYSSCTNIDSRYRMKPVANILAEIESLGTRHVMFIDDNFIGNPRAVVPLLHEFKTMNMVWHTAVSADIGRRPELLDLMAESGCKSLFIGFESVNPRSLKSCNKQQNKVVDYDRTIAAIHERGMMVNASLAFGFDEDDENVFPATLQWLVRNRIATMTAHILTPYPGTRLYKRLLEEGRITDFDLTHYNTAHVVFRPESLTPAQLLDGHQWMYDQFYSWANILRRWPVCAAQVPAYLQFALVYRKFGKVTCAVGKAFGMRRMAKLAKAVAYPARRPRAGTATAEHPLWPSVLRRAAAQ